MRTGDGGDGGGDYYDVLGVPRDATADEILRAYRRLVRQHHPDFNPGAGSRRFQEITDAYDVIGDAERRRRYDATGGSGAGRGVRIPVNRPPGPAAGSGAQRGDAGAAERPVIRLSFQEAVRGTVATVDVPEARPCPTCGGSGLEQADEGGCRDCGGTGSIVRRTGQIPVRHICTRCGGRGRPAPRPCGACGATGTVAGTTAVKVRVPAGVQDGATLRIRRREAELYAVVRVEPDGRFGRQGDDLTVRVEVSPAQLVLGGTVEVPTVDGPPVTVRIPPGTQPGRRLRVAGRGLRRADRTGDLLVTVDLVIPTELSPAERAAWEAVAAATERGP